MPSATHRAVMAALTLLLVVAALLVHRAIGRHTAGVLTGAVAAWLVGRRATHRGPRRVASRPSAP
ncbi:hypothetical protein [Streptomyces bugieae]|uniref:Uncharacterized protein n=1 Tax=Streptomyces bugieae TaxID=3098223 RepID=A0ABU7NY16_9ACTN|nr:hypothetical protein [Streptomyces sp. DSM 41528]